MKPIYILGIESSCDDTSIAVLKNRTVLSNITANQEVHEKYGGVVPELASRAHQANILPTLDRALKKADVSLDQINAIAFANGPGLLGSLMVGASFAKGLSLAKDIPLIGIDHMQAHVLANFITSDENLSEAPEFPFLCLTVSGGHTQLMLVKDYFEMDIVGKTRDDAAGEAFDKIGKMLGLGYPAGPMVDKLSKKGNPLAFAFPVTNLEGFDFSFSGIKTAVMYFLQKKEAHFIKDNIEDLCTSVQHTIIEMLLLKFKAAIQSFNPKGIAIAGGVSANSQLREKTQILAQTHNLPLHIPAFSYCTDNGAMIGIAGYYKYLQKEFSPLDIKSQARLY